MPPKVLPTQIVDEDVPMIVHRIPRLVTVPGVAGQVSSYEEFRIPLSENAAFEIEHGLR
jgi:hypothetical protein